MRLVKGTIIRVHGFVMLKGLDDGGEYKVQSTPTYHGNPTYQFTRRRGKKVACRHLASNVDAMISENNLNRIEVVS